MNISRVKIVIASIVLLGVSACSPITKIEQPHISDWIQLSKTQSIGQTFTARYSGLEGIEINVNPDKIEKGKIILHLKNDPQDIDDIASTDISISRFSQSTPYKLKFAPQNLSFNQDYFIAFEIKGNAVLSLGMAAGDSYQNGALYQNNEPLDHQLSFNLIYNRKLALFGIVIEILGWIKYSAIGIFLFIIPGWALLSLLYNQWCDKYWFEKIGLAAGLSLAIYPIFLLWTHLIGLNLGAVYAWFPPVAGLGIIVWRNRRALISPKFQFSWIKKIKLTDVLFIAISAIIIFVRFWAIRNLPVPMWGDGFQHTVIAQLLVDNKGLFNSWQPYAEISSFTYHFGFHSLVAVFHWISGIALPQATLWTGQILNVLAVLCLVPLVIKISKNPWGSIFCILIAGLVSPMPMYYLNWGRYTQLAGQIILIACVYFAWESLDAINKKWQIIIINCIVMAGLGLTHYRVLIFALCFYFVYLLFHLRVQFKNTIITTAIIGAGSMILFCPWLFHVFEGRIPSIQAAILSTPVNKYSQSSILVDPIGNISFYLPIILWIFSAIVLGWGILFKKSAILIISAWWGIILFLANPHWFRLPGAGVITNFAIFIAAYIPTGILQGGAFGQLSDFLINKLENNTNLNFLYKYSFFDWFLTIMILFVGICFVRNTLILINQNNFALISKPDLKAMDWINHNIPEESIFFVNTFLAYNNTTTVGSDGGWWLPYLSSVNSILPPINYATEKNQNPNFNKAINDITFTIQEKGITSSKAWDLLSSNHITHIYIGQKQGRVNNSGPMIDPFVLLKDSRFEEIYHIDRVWIFRLVK